MSAQTPEDRTIINQKAASQRGGGDLSSNLPGDLKAGQVVAGSYKVLDFIGRGGMGAVYRVRHLFLDKDLALKTLTGSAVSEVVWRRFQQEGQAIARLDHANIIRIHDLGLINEKQPYYAMDLVDGVSLSELLHQKGALTPAQALPIFRQLAAGLAYAHERGIIHRDLKPANIMLINVENKGVPTAKILDFGLAKLTAQGGENLTKTGEIFGSPFYMSPEQALGQPVDERTDIYSFGCALYEALTADVPFRGKNALETMFMHTKKEAPRLSDKRPDLAFRPELENFIARLLAKSPAARIKSFNDVAAQLLTLERNPAQGASPAIDVSHLARRTNAHDGANSSQTYNSQNLSANRASITGKPWFWPALAVALTGGLIMISVSCYVFFAPRKVTNKVRFQTANEIQQVNRPAIVTDGERLPPSTNTSPVSVTCDNNSGAQSPYSKIEARGSKTIKVFEFPANTCLGQITYSLDRGVRWTKGRAWRRQHINDDEDNPYYDAYPAQGRVEFEAGDALAFHPQGQTCATPFIFKKFRPTDFVALDLDYDPAVNNDFLTYIKHMTSLIAVSLKNTAVDARSMPILESLPNLHILNVSNTGITGDDLARSKFINALTKLEFGHDKSVSSMLMAMAHSKNMNEMLLNGDSLSPADLRILAHMSNLTQIKLQHCDIDNQKLKVLAGSPVLDTLDLSDNAITPAATATLASMKLKQLTLTFADWSDNQIETLTRELNRHRQCEVKMSGRAQFQDIK